MKTNFFESYKEISPWWSNREKNKGMREGFGILIQQWMYWLYNIIFEYSSHCQNVQCKCDIKWLYSEVNVKFETSEDKPVWMGLEGIVLLYCFNSFPVFDILGASNQDYHLTFKVSLNYQPFFIRLYTYLRNTRTRKSNFRKILLSKFQKSNAKFQDECLAKRKMMHGCECARLWMCTMMNLNIMDCLDGLGWNK